MAQTSVDLDSWGLSAGASPLKIVEGSVPFERAVATSKALSLMLGTFPHNRGDSIGPYR